MFPLGRVIAATCIVIAIVGCKSPRHGTSDRTAFHAFTDLSSFTRAEAAGAVTLVSPEIRSITWDQLVVSWNARCPDNAQLVVEARAFDGQSWTRYYSMGIWSESDARQSVKGQKDKDASVSTDTLLCKRPMRAAQVRLTLTGDNEKLPEVKFLGVSLLNSKAPIPPASRTNQAAWGKTLDVPQRSQLGHKGGSGWCSPTSVSMILAYWSQQLNRPEMNLTVPEVAAGVFDPGWGGTGNWPFNMAFAAKFNGMRAYTTRLDELAPVEDYIAKDVPVALSVSFDLLNGREKDMGNGHLIVVVGFTPSGDVVVNDPWPSPKRENSVRKIFPRDRVLKAWQRSDRTVYLIGPERNL